jgi:hypothetical protein
MKYIHICTLAAALLILPATGCSDAWDDVPIPTEEQGETITLTFGVDLDEEYGCSATRAEEEDDALPTTFAEEVTYYATHEYTDIKQEDYKADEAPIYILAFDENHLLTNVYTCTYKESSLGEHQHHLHHYFTVTLYKTQEKRYFHILANHTLNTADVPFATESDIFNSELMVATNKDVYWRRIELEKVDNDVVNYLNGIKLVRNFARIKLNFKFDSSSTFQASDFKEVKWRIMNLPTKSYVAPYLKGQEFATYVHVEGDGSSTDGEEHSSTKPYTYDELYEEGYRCHVPRTPSNADSFYQYSKATEAEGDESDWQPWYQPLYTYENEGSSDSDLFRRTSILIRATKTDGTTQWFYRLNLVDPKRNNEQLYLMRNVSYEVDVTQINDEGFGTASEAFLKAAANNISGSSSTSTFTNVSANNAALRVEYMTKYLFCNTPVTLNYRYVPVVTALNEDGTYKATNNSVIVTSAEGYSGTTVPTFVGADNTKYAIADYSIATVDNDGSNYRQITFTPNTPQKGGVSTTSKIRVRVNDADYPMNNNLYRDVTFVLRNRYLIKNMQISNDGDNTYTLTVDIPDGLPQEIFPLDFTFETYPPLVYPNAELSIMRVEGMDNSLFNKGTSDSFHYHRAVTRSTYDDKFKTTNGYKQVTFYFHIITENLPSNNHIMFAVYEPSFSPAPDEQIDWASPSPLFGAYSFTGSTDPVLSKEGEYTNDTDAYAAWNGF